MFRANWRDPRFWRWWWHERVTFESRIAFYVFLFALLLGSGLFAAERLASAGAEVAPSTPILIETTVEKAVTIHERGKVIRKLVPVVRRIRVKSPPVVETRTALDLRTITTPGGVRIVQRVTTVKHVTTVPRVEKHVVTVAGWDDQAHQRGRRGYGPMHAIQPGGRDAGQSGGQEAMRNEG